MNTSILNTFVEATLDVTRNMAQLDATVGKPKIKRSQAARGHVTGFIELSGTEHFGSNHNGTLAISFDTKALRLVYQNMLGETLNKIDDVAFNLVGEIANMVCGGAKKRLADLGYDFDLTSPTILTGKRHVIDHCNTNPVTTLPMSFAEGTMYLEVSMSH